MQNKDFQKFHREYMASDEWQWVRQEVIKRDRRCQKCKKPYRKVELFDVHHIHYNHLGDADINEVDSCLLLCRECHEVIHGKAWFQSL